MYTVDEITGLREYVDVKAKEAKHVLSSGSGYSSRLEA